MGINTYTDLVRLAFSPFKKNEDQQDVVENIFKLSIRTALVSGGLVIISETFKRSVTQEGAWRAFVPDLKIGLAVVGTFALVATYFSYKFFKMIEGEGFYQQWEKLNKHSARFERNLCLIGFGGALTAIFARSFFKENHLVSSIAKHSIQPLLCMGFTALLIRASHGWLQRSTRKTQATI